MIDFKATDTGDIIANLEQPLSTCKIKFACADYSTQRIKFFVRPFQPQIKKNVSQKIKFRYMDTTGMEDARAQTVNELDEALQSIYLHLRTEEGETINYDDGTDLYTQKHTVYRNDNDLDNIRAITQGVVSGILPGATANISYVDCSNAGYFRFQSVKITVEYNNEIVGEFVF